MLLRKIDDHAGELAAGVGLVSVGMGLALTFAPGPTAALLGWGDRVRLARAVGVADLVVGPALLLGRRRPEWMASRALLSAAIALSYVWVLTNGTPERGRAIRGLGLMSGVTAGDSLLALRLRDAAGSRAGT